MQPPPVAVLCRECFALCRGIDPLEASVVAIDGSKLKAVNAKARSFTQEKLRRRLGEIDMAIAKYMAELDRADEILAKTGMRPFDTRLSRVIKKLAHYKKEGNALRAIETRMQSTGRRCL